MKTTKTRVRATGALLVVSTLVWFVFTTTAQHLPTADRIEPSIAMHLKISGINGDVAEPAYKATPFRYLHARTGGPIEQVVPAVVRTAADSHSAHEYRLSNALVTSSQTGRTRNANARGTEKVTFSYQAIEWAYGRM